MKKKIFIAAAVIFSSHLQAQKNEPAHLDSTSSLDEIILTANKYPNKASLTGKVVTVITKEQLEKSGGMDLSQILAEQSGIFIAGANSNAGKEKSIYLRGARIDHTLITIDGIPVYDPSGIGGNFDLRNLAVANIERIEILKGSQSTLYGSDAIAGVINIITKKNSVKKLAGNAMLSYGSNNTIKGNAGLNGKTGKLDYSTIYSFYKTAGINEAINKNMTLITDKDGFKQHNFQTSFGIKATDNIYIQPFFRFSKINGDIDQGAFTDELDYTYSQKSWQAGIRNEFKIGKSNLNVLYSYNNINRNYLDDSIESRNGFYYLSKGLYKGAEQFADVYANIPLNNTLKLTAGMDFRSSNSHQEFLGVSPYGIDVSIYSNDSLKQHQTGAYAALNWNYKSGFNLELGSRVNFHSQYGSQPVFNVNPSYLINKKLKLFANLSSAYRTPSLYQLFSEYGNKNLQPEASISAEAGLQFFSVDDKFTGRAIAFSRNVKDVIFFYFNSTTFQSKYINQDRQKDHGYELEASYKINSGTTVKAFYNFVTGSITTKQNGKDTVYNNLLRRPKSSGGINISSQLCKNLFVSSNLSITGKRKDAYFDNTTFNTVNIVLKSYVLLDAYADYGFVKNKLKVFVDLRNITNSRFSEISGFNTLRFNGYSGVRFQF